MKKRLMKNGQTHTVIVWVLVLLITTLLYVTQTDCEVEFFPHLDIIVFELLLIPIVLACLWKGVVAGLATSLGVSLLLFPYLIMDWEGLSAADLNRVLRILVVLSGVLHSGESGHGTEAGAATRQGRPRTLQPLGNPWLSSPTT